MAENTTETKETTVTTEATTTPTTTPAEATPPKVKTEEEIRAELQKEFDKQADKRVTDAIKKKEKEWEDKQAKEKMTDEERRRSDEAEKAQTQARKDYELTIKGLRLDVVDAVAELGLDTGFRNLIAVEDLAGISDEDERKKKLTERVKGMKALFDKAVEKAVAKEKAEFLKGSTPPTGDKKKSDESQYDTYKKAGNVKGMISEKLNKLNNPDKEE